MKMIGGFEEAGGMGEKKTTKMRKHMVLLHQAGFNTDGRISAVIWVNG